MVAYGRGRCTVTVVITVRGHTLFRCEVANGRIRKSSTVLVSSAKSSTFRRVLRQVTYRE